MIIVTSKSKARLFASWLEPQRCLSGIFCGGEMLGRMILAVPVLQDIGLIQYAIGESELWIACDRSVEKIDRYVPILSRQNSSSSTQGGAGAEIKIICL